MKYRNPKYFEGEWSWAGKAHCTLSMTAQFAVWARVQKRDIDEVRDDFLRGLRPVLDETAVKTRYNCTECTIDQYGDIYIAGPGPGRWLTRAEISDLLDWMDLQ